ncbi:MAG: sortase [bacterium]
MPSDRLKTARPISPTRHKIIKAAAITLIIIGAVILIYPFVPIIRYEIFQPDPVYPYATLLTNTEQTDNLEIPTEHLPSIENKLPDASRLVIPKIGVNMPIVEGENEKALFRGSWRVPETSTPDNGGNTVLTVHRFQYLAGPNTLALADRLEVGDLIIVYWKSADDTITEFDYRISKTYLVEPNQVEILDNTVETKLTLFTCAPMFSTKNRLVIEGSPIENP